MSAPIIRRIFAVLAVAILVPACKFSGFTTTFAVVVLNAQMRSSQLVPVPAVPAAVTTTNATLIVDGNRHFIDYTLNYTGSGTITTVEVRIGVAGTNGPAIFTLASGPFTNPFSGTLTSLDVLYAPAYGVLSFDDALNLILNGQTYVLVSTVGDPTGEMRAQLGTATLASAVLNGAQEVPPVAGTGTGTFTVDFDPTQSILTATLNFSGLTGSANAAHLHFGAAGVGSGPAIFNLSTIAFTSPLVVTLTIADFMTDPSVPAFEDAIDALMTGQMYVNVHTTLNPGGEIRGQIGPARLTSSLTDGDVVPGPVVSGFTGSASVILNATQTEALVLLTHDVLTPDSVRLCTEDPGLIGPLLYDVDALAGSAASPLQAILREPQLIPSPPRAILTFTDFANALLTGKTYLEVRSPSFTDGAIRGQIQ